MAYPYPVKEVAADAAVHATGLIAAICGTVLLALHVARVGIDGAGLAVAVYLSALLFALIASAAYHMVPWDGPRGMLHKIDHAAIYLKIAGTYTPLVLVIGSAFSYTILAAIWAIACCGAVAKLTFWSTDARGSLALYLALGWAALLLIWPMWQGLSGAAFALIAAGGGLYSIGAVFFAMRAFAFQNAVWHGFVLAAGACFFGAITLSISA